MYEELLHGMIDFFTFDGDSCGIYNGMVSYRRCETRDDVVLFVDFDKSSEKSQKLLDFFTSHQESFHAHVTSIVGQRDSVITCFNCHIYTAYRSDAKILLGRCGKLIEVTCEAWIEDEIIYSSEDLFNWNNAFFNVAGLYLFSSCRDDFDYSIDFQCNKEIEFTYSNQQSQIVSSFSGDYKLPISRFFAEVAVKFIRQMPFENVCNYVLSFISFLNFIFGVNISYGPLICNDYSVMCKDNIEKCRASLWFKNSVRIKNHFETNPYINPLIRVEQIEDNSGVLFERWNVVYQKHPTAVTVLERLKEITDSYSEYIDDIAVLVRATLILVEDKPSYKDLLYKTKLKRVMQETGFINNLDDAEKLAEVRNACSHYREIKQEIVIFDEMPRLRNVAMNLFKEYMIKQVLLPPV